MWKSCVWWGVFSHDTHRRTTRNRIDVTRHWMVGIESVEGDGRMNLFQALEQMDAFLRDFSPVLWAYKQNLLKQGFTEEESMQLVINYQESVIKGGTQK